jgi:hypothetical protein
MTVLRRLYSMTEDNWRHQLSQSAQMQEVTALPVVQIRGSCALERRAYPCPINVKYPHTATKNAMTAAIVKAFVAFSAAPVCGTSPHCRSFYLRPDYRC